MAYVRVGDAGISYDVYGPGRPFLFCSATVVDGQCWKANQVSGFFRHLTIESGFPPQFFTEHRDVVDWCLEVRLA